MYVNLACAAVLNPQAPAPSVPIPSSPPPPLLLHSDPPQIYAGSVRDQDLPLFFRDLRALYTPQRFEVREFNVPDAYSFRVNGVEVGPGRPGVRPPGAEQQWPESPRSAESDTAIVVWSNGHGLGTPEAHMRYRAFVVHDLRAGGESRGQQYVYAYALIEVVTRGLMRGGQREDSAVLTPFVSDLGAESVAVGFDMRVSHKDTLSPVPVADITPFSSRPSLGSLRKVTSRPTMAPSGGHSPRPSATLQRATSATRSSICTTASRSAPHAQSPSPGPDHPPGADPQISGIAAPTVSASPKSAASPTFQRGA